MWRKTASPMSMIKAYPYLKFCISRHKGLAFLFRMTIPIAKSLFSYLALGLFPQPFGITGVKTLKRYLLTWAVIGILGKCVGDVGQLMPIVPVLQGTDIQVAPLLQLLQPSRFFLQFAMWI